jgi:crotonobetainyl-CoA:carnitine CoA-transferase CaiB-like acyl-CoA transferase
MGPLDGIRIIDMTSVLMGPFATQALGDMGGDVIKVEAPQGDVVRQIGPARHEDMGPIFLNTNRNKRSLSLDLKRPEGIAVLHRLIADADVLVYNVRPQAMARLGLDYDAVEKINPRIVYAGLFGFGQDGPYAARPAYDDLIQGASTLSYLIARASDGTPRFVPTAVADRIVGITAVGGILASLIARGRTGRGQRVDIPMFETMVGFVLGDHLGGLTYEPPLDGGGYARQLSPYRRPYRTKDSYICALVYNDKQWEGFLRAIGRESLQKEDARFATFANRSRNIDFVYEWLSDIFGERTTAEWMRVLEEADIPMMPMHDFESVLEDPHLTATRFFTTVEHPTEGPIRSMRAPVSFFGTPTGPIKHAPCQGEHSVEILRQAGYSAEEINSFLASGAVQALPVSIFKENTA